MFRSNACRESPVSIDARRNHGQLCHTQREQTSGSHNGWAGPVAADRRAPSRPGQHGHIALLTAFVGRPSRPSLRADDGKSISAAVNGPNQPKLIYTLNTLAGGDWRGKIRRKGGVHKTVPARPPSCKECKRSSNNTHTHTHTHTHTQM